MLNSHYRNDNKFQSLLNSCFPAREIFVKLLQRTHKETDFELSSLIENLRITLKETSWIPGSYFEGYYDRFIYETILSIYSQIYISQETGKQSLQDCIKHCEPDCINIDSRASQLSRNRKIIFSDFDIRKCSCSFQKKTAAYYSVMDCTPFSPSSDSSPEIVPDIPHVYLTPQNRLSNIESYPNIIYSIKNSSDGISLFNFYDMVTNFLHLHKVDKLEDELSVFQFEYIHYPIQYLRCYATYLSRAFSQDVLPRAYLPLWLYVHLFDTHFISLTDYLLDKYEDTINQIYDNPISFQPVYYERQLLNGFLIPIIQECIRQVLSSSLYGNLDKIRDCCQTYLNRKPFGTYEHNYLKLLQGAVKQLESVTFPDQKSVIDPKSAKTGSPNYRFNLVFSKCFFLQDLPNYFENCSAMNFSHISIDDCIALTAADFSKNCDMYSDLTIKTCFSYKESLLS